MSVVGGEKTHPWRMGCAKAAVRCPVGWIVGLLAGGEKVGMEADIKPVVSVLV